MQPTENNTDTTMVNLTSSTDGALNRREDRTSRKFRRRAVMCSACIVPYWSPTTLPVSVRWCSSGMLNRSSEKTTTRNL